MLTMMCGTFKFVFVVISQKKYTTSGRYANFENEKGEVESIQAGLCNFLPPRHSTKRKYYLDNKMSLEHYLEFLRL